MWLGEGRLLNIANKVQGSPKGRYNKPIELHNDQCTDVTDDALKSLYIIVVNLYIYTQCAAVKLVSQKLEQLKKHIFTTKLLDIFHFS